MNFLFYNENISRDNSSRKRDFHSPSNVFIDLTKDDIGSPRNELTNTIKHPNSSYSSISYNSNSFKALVNSRQNSFNQEKEDNLGNFSTKPHVKGIDIQQDVLRTTKKMTPMHLKFYESTQQNVLIIK